MGRSLHCQVEHHVRTKFATPLLHAIGNFEFYDIFFLHIIHNHLLYIFLKFVLIFFFVVIVLVQFGVIIVRNNMFHKKKQIIKT